MHYRLFILIALSLILISCADKYRAYRSQYEYENSSGHPQYSDLYYWAAHPDKKKDPSDSVPLALAMAKKELTADVFFLHPTTFTKRKDRHSLNARINDAYINAKTDYSTILYQASVFNGSCRVFAPRYRQAHISNFFTSDQKQANGAFEIAYQDVKSAFEFYLQHWNQARPFFIAAHSQGSFLAEKLLKEFFDSSTGNASALRKQLIAAYVIGWAVPSGYFSTLKMCEDSLQTGCLCSWRTLRRGYVPRYYKKEKGLSLVTNPLTWTTGGEFAPRSLNRGSILSRFNRVYLHSTDAQIANGFLYVRKPRFPGSFFYFTRNYHIGDINLYYVNMRDNIAARLAAFQAGASGKR